MNGPVAGAMEQGTAEKPAPYVTLGIPRALSEEVEDILRAHPELGYRNRSEFTIQATRDLILRTREMLYHKRLVEGGGVEATNPLDATRPEGAGRRRKGSRE